MAPFQLIQKNVLNKYDFTGFDMAIMQDCSQCPIHPERKALFYEYAEKHSNLLKKEQHRTSTYDDLGL